MRGFETAIEKCARIYTKDAKTSIIWGAECSTDGQGKIFLPALSDRTDPKVLTKTRLYMGHEVSHVLHSDFTTVGKVIKEGGMGKKNILNALEDVRIERLWELEYTGCQEDFRDNYKDFVRSEFNDRLISPIESLVAKVMNIATIRAREKQLGFDAGLNVPAPIEKLFQEKVGDVIDQLATAKTMKQIEDLTDLVYERFKDDEPPPSAGGKGEPDKKPDQGELNEEKGGNDGDDEEGDASSPSDGDGTPEPHDGSDDHEGESNDAGGSESKSEGDDGDKDNEDGNGSDGDVGDDPQGTNRRPKSNGTEEPGEDGSNPGGSNGIPGDEETPEQKAEKEELQKLREELKDETETGDKEVKTAQDFTGDLVNKYATTSDEYLVDANVKDLITKPMLSPGSMEAAKKDMAKGKETLAYLGQRLRHLFLTNRSKRITRFLKTGPLDAYRIMEDESDLICKKKMKGRNQDSVVGTLLDCSGSMTEEKYSNAVQLCLAMGHFLEQIKVPLSMLGYSGTHDVDSSKKRIVPVMIYIMKEFNESINKVMGRFRGVVNRQSTYDLDGLRVLAKMILSRPEPKKIIFIYSDGKPDTGNIYLSNKLFKSYVDYIKRLRKVGVTVYGFGIDCNVSTIFGADQCVTVNRYNIREFPKIVFKQLSKLLLE